MTKTLIVFFSRKGNNYVSGNIVNLPIGNTKVAASKIQSLLNCDIFEIESVNEYPLDYTECTTQAKVELKENSRPKIKGQLPDVSGYDTIILGYPNWWGTFPMAVWTFLESVDLKGKTIMPYCTHQGSGMGVSERDLKKLCKDSILAKGLAIKGSNVQLSDNDIKNWLKL